MARPLFLARPVLHLSLGVALLSAIPSHAETVGYWRFEEQTSGNVSATGTGGAVPNTVLDTSGNGNHMQTWTTATAPTYTTSVPFPSGTLAGVPATGALNTASLDFRGSPVDIYSGSNSGSKPINSKTFSAWTVEASFCLDVTGRWQVIVGKDGNPIGGQPPLSLKVRADNTVEIGIVDGSGTGRWCVGTTKVEAGKWYQAAATATGSELSLWIKPEGCRDYIAQGSVPIQGAFFNTYSAFNQPWIIGRGMWNGAQKDATDGRIDEVRISDTALTPDQFLGNFVSTDSDADGLPDAWELVHFRANAAETDAEILAKQSSLTVDPDGDGYANRVELRSGTSPAIADNLTGKLSRQVWLKLPGDVIHNLTGNPRFYGKSDITALNDGISTPRDFADNFGERLQGWLTAPVTGDYTFWIAGDNQCELWLSTDQSKFHKQRIASVPVWSAPEEWEKFPAQKSAVIHLVAGQKYFIECLHKEGISADSLSVAWQVPGEVRQLIPAQQFEPYLHDPEDQDLDGLADQWEQSVGLSTDFFTGAEGEDGAGGDPDDDGFSNDMEWFADSDPHEYERISGGLTCEVWRELAGATVAHLTNSSRFLQRPTFRGFLPGADAPVDDGENYGRRLRGYVIIPESGNYRFHIAGDDQVELWIAESGSHFERRKAAWHTSWTNHLEWNKFGSQQTAVLALTAGQKVYVEALQKEALGGDNLSVGWSFNGGSPGLIPADHLEAFATPTNDVDEDYLPDAWELAHGFDVGDNGLLYPDQCWSADPDGDGFNNLLEALSSGDPYEAGGNIGYVRRDIWTGIDGETVAHLTSSPKFTQAPNSSTHAFGNLEFGAYGDRYGQKLSGALVPPLSGNWRFSIASDDSSELWLSTTASATNKEKIASVSGYTGVGNYEVFPTQKSDWIQLDSNNAYYFEVLHKEHLGADHVSVVWEYEPLNWALAENGSTATQSSTYGGLEADRAIDGNTDGNPAVPTATHTQSLANSWWQVDFGQDRPVNRVVLFNRTDAIQNQERLSNFRISVLDAAGNELVGQDFFTTSGYVQKSMAWDLPQTVNARKIKVQILGYNLKGNGFLCLAEVQAFDWIPENNRRVVNAENIRTLGDDPLDQDGDGLPDAWEMEHFGSLAEGAYGDYDGDGVSNRDEFLADRITPREPPGPPVAQVKVVAGPLHSLALKSDGTVWAWGGNGNGQLGDGTMTNRSSPVQVPGLAGVISLAAGPLHSLALKSDGTVWAWGGNGNGQLGDGTTTQRPSPLQVPGLTQVVSLAAGSSYSLALKSDGTVWAWGGNGNGQLGDGTTTQRTSPVQVAGLSGVISLASGWNHSLALKSDGTVWAWGSNSSGQLGDGTMMQRISPVEIAGLSGVVSLAGGGKHSLALKSDGTVWAWGDNSSGELGDGTTTQRTSPVQVPGLNGVISLSAGYHLMFMYPFHGQSLALKSDGTVWAWGWNGDRYFDDGTSAQRTSPVQIAGLSGMTSVAAGGEHSLALKSDGTIWAWGANGDGKVGDGGATQRTSPVQTYGLTSVISLAAGGERSLAQKPDGTVWAWGCNSSGQLGDGTTMRRISPVEVSGLSGVISLACGSRHSLAVKSNGTVWGWGLNSSRQLGAETTQEPGLRQILGLDGVVSVAAGESHSLALKSDGTVWGWGGNYNGQLGAGATNLQTSPVQTSGLTGVIWLAAGNSHSLALKSDGTVWALGNNSWHQLGDGTTTSRFSPVQVAGLSGVISLAAGNYHSLALKSDGTVWTWGYNSKGQLGDGSTTNRSSPVQVAGLSGVISLAAGHYHSLALKSDGSVWAWGSNDSGQLGDGTTTDRTSPVQIPGLNGVTSLAAGFSHSLALKEDSTILAWGSSDFTQLANGFSSYYTEPRAVLGLNLLHPTPLIEITAPANEAIVPLGSSVTLQTNPTVSSGSIEKVVFYADGIYLGEDDTAPFTYTYTAESWGNYDINAIAVSSAGAFSQRAHIRLQTPYDSEGEGMPDWWELEHFGSQAEEASGDYDHDGVSNLDEFLAGTDPADQSNGFLDEDEDGLPDWWEQTIIDASGNPSLTIHNIDPNDDFDGDYLPNETEWLAGSSPTDAASTGPDSDGDGLPDAWEKYYRKNLTDLSATSNADGDWLDDPFEYKLGTSPLIHDDTDLDGWLDRHEASVVLNSGGLFGSIGALTPWGDQDGDGGANAAEVASGADPLTAQAASSYAPLVKLLAADFSDAGSQATWNNTGGLGGTFTSVAGKPLAATLGSHAAVQFPSTTSAAMVGPWTAPWLNASGSRTVVAWVYNPDVTTAQQDVVCSWGADSLAAPISTLFSCRYGTPSTGGALAFSGTGSMDRGWGTVPPQQGQWSFVVYRYDQRTGALLAMRDFQAGVSEYGVFLQTGIFNTTGKPNRLVVGGENDGNGGIQTGQVTALGLGELRIYGEALPLAAVLSLYEETKGAYGISGSLADADGDGVPDILEASLGWNPAVADGDQDGVVDVAEFDNGTSGKDYYNSRSHAVQVVGGDAQIIDVGTETPIPLVYKVTDLDGAPLPNAPFNVDVTTLPVAGGKVRLAPAGSPLGSSVNTRTDANGEVKIYFKAN